MPIEDLEAVLAFMYEGQVNVSQTRLHTFMKLAEVLQVRGLTDAQTARTRSDKVGIQNGKESACVWYYHYLLNSETDLALSNSQYV